MMRSAVLANRSERQISAETLNQWTHAAGFALSVPASLLLLGWLGEKVDFASSLAFGLYAFSLAALYGASTLSHSFENRPRLRTLFRIVDQACIFLFIAASFSPFALMCARNPFGIAQLVAMWVLAVLGIALRIRRKGSEIGAADLALCLLTGWIPVLSMPQIIAEGGWDGSLLVAAGAAAYCGGIFFLMNDHRHPAFHSIWHLSTIAGTACHYLFMLNYVAC